MSSLVVWRPRAVWLRPDMPMVRRRGRGVLCGLGIKSQLQCVLCGPGVRVLGQWIFFCGKGPRTCGCPIFLVELGSSGFVNPGELQMFCNNLQPPPARKRTADVTRTAENTPPSSKDWTRQMFTGQRHGYNKFLVLGRNLNQEALNG